MDRKANVEQVKRILAGYGLSDEDMEKCFTLLSEVASPQMPPPQPTPMQSVTMEMVKAYVDGRLEGLSLAVGALRASMSEDGT